MPVAIPGQGYSRALHPRLSGTCSYLCSSSYKVLVSLCAVQCPLQQATHAQIYQLQQQLNQAVNIKQQDLEEAYQVNAGLRLWGKRVLHVGVCVGCGSQHHGPCLLLGVSLKDNGCSGVHAAAKGGGVQPTCCPWSCPHAAPTT